MTTLRVTGPDINLTTKFVEAVKNSALQVHRVAYIFNLDQSVVNQWMKAGRRIIEEERDPTTPYEENCLEFYLRISRAESELESELIDRIRTAEDWRAAHALLQSRFAKDWSPRQSLKIEDLSKLDPTRMTDEELEKFIADRVNK